MEQKSDTAFEIQTKSSEADVDAILDGVPFTPELKAQLESNTQSNNNQDEEIKNLGISIDGLSKSDEDQEAEIGTLDNRVTSLEKNSGGGGENRVFTLTRSVLIEIKANQGEAGKVGIRSVDFYKDGVKLELGPNDFTATATNMLNANTSPTNVFDTSLSKVGGASGKGWMCGAGWNGEVLQLAVTFKELTSFDAVAVNNYHDNGMKTYAGVKTMEVSVSSDVLSVDTTPATTANKQGILFAADLRRHADLNREDGEIVYVDNHQDLDQYLNQFNLENNTAGVKASEKWGLVAVVTQNEGDTIPEQVLLKDVADGVDVVLWRGASDDGFWLGTKTSKKAYTHCSTAHNAALLSVSEYKDEPDAVTILTKTISGSLDAYVDAVIIRGQTDSKSSMPHSILQMKVVRAYGSMKTYADKHFIYASVVKVGGTGEDYTGIAIAGTPATLV